ncbi:MAG: 3-hydroxyacyl-CoA dehydrogenase NAD-binding domain-containing protein [Rhodospirillales bacterium]
MTLIDATEQGLSAGLERVRNNYATSAKRGSITQSEAGKRLGLISGSTDRDAAVGADVIVEAVFESMELKREIFADLTRKTQAGTILATNTSALDIDDIAAATDRPEDVIEHAFLFARQRHCGCWRWCAGRRAVGQAIATAMEVGKVIGKIPVLSGNCDGLYRQPHGCQALRAGRSAAAGGRDAARH